MALPDWNADMAKDGQGQRVKQPSWSPCSPVMERLAKEQAARAEVAAKASHLKEVPRW